MLNQVVKVVPNLSLAQVAVVLSLLTPAYAQPASDQSPMKLAPMEVRRILSQNFTDLAAREQQAPAAIRERLSELRAQLQSEGASFTVGYNPALDVPLEILAGTRVPRSQPGIAEMVNQRAVELRQIDILSAKRFNFDVDALTARACSSNSKSFDWRREGKVTSVQAQICGTCWDFTAMGAFEGSYAIRNDQMIDTSEQYILNCSGAGSCLGGWWMPVFDYMLTHGNAREQDVPFTGSDTQACPTGIETPYRASSWGFVANDISTIPSNSAIKEALCDHGPVATAVFADVAFQAYSGGIFDRRNQQYDWINHGVVIIGWDDDKGAWLIKNSWGPTWGEAGGFGSEKGYMWIAYGSNNIGIATAWVDAKSNKYPLEVSWFNTLKQLDFDTRPLADQ
jgi:C1A family cysteine protease